MDDRRLVRIDRGRTRQKGQWRERLKIGRIAVETGIEGRGHRLGSGIIGAEMII
jgi:hypothetical protein